MSNIQRGMWLYLTWYVVIVHGRSCQVSSTDGGSPYHKQAFTP